MYETMCTALRYCSSVLHWRPVHSIVKVWFPTMYCIALRDEGKETHKQVLWEQRLWVKQISYGVNLLENKYLGRLGCVAQSIVTLQFLEAALGNFCPFPLLFKLGKFAGPLAQGVLERIEFSFNLLTKEIYLLLGGPRSHNQCFSFPVKPPGTLP